MVVVVTCIYGYHMCVYTCMHMHMHLVHCIEFAILVCGLVCVYVVQGFTVPTPWFAPNLTNPCHLWVPCRIGGIGNSN